LAIVFYLIEALEKNSVTGVMFSFESSKQGETTVFHLHGQLAMKDTVALRQAVQKVMAEKPDSLVFDLQDLQYLDSSGIALLLHTQKGMQAQGKRLRLRSMNQEIQTIFAVANLLDTFDLD